MGPATPIFAGWLGAALLMLVLFLYSRRVRDASIVDVGWSASIGLLVLGYALFSEAVVERRIVIAMMGGLWSVRLSLHLFFDRVFGKSEDGRYRTLRERWGDRAEVNFFIFFQAQAFLAVVFSLPFLAVLANPAPALTVWEWIAIPLFAVALLGESFADRQLARFRADPVNRGRVCRIGLWNYSRHPNYFFEWLHWWTYAVMGIGFPWGAANLLFPIAMSFFLFKLTGIPATEEQALKSRGEEYRRYQETTNRFFPWFPKERPS